MSQKISYIEIEYSEDAMFGPDEENRENVNIPASFEKWEQMLAAELEQEYPGAEITIENSINDKHSAQLADGEESDEDTVLVGEIVHKVWESWDWTIENS